MSQGNRFNKGKLRWRNVPPYLVRPLVKVGQAGEIKYGTYNFLKGLPILDTLESLQRHLDSFLDPYQPDVDPESGENHLAHVAWNALVALYHMENMPELDDRYKLEPSKAEIEYAKKIIAEKISKLKTTNDEF